VDVEWTKCFHLIKKMASPIMKHVSSSFSAVVKQSQVQLYADAFQAENKIE